MDYFFSAGAYFEISFSVGWNFDTLGHVIKKLAIYENF